MLVFFKMIHFLKLFRQLLFVSLLAYLNIPDAISQYINISGKVIDSITKEPLVFVNIIYSEKGTGTVSSIDGNFEILTNQKPEFLRFSYIGYYPKIMNLESIQTINKLIVELKPKAYDINEVKIFPGVNPANRLIRLASENRLSNHPEKINSFSYIAYDKMIFTLHEDSLQELNRPLKKTRKKRDTGYYYDEESSDIKAEDFLNKHHLLIMESISSRKYKYPDKEKTEIIASRVSGFKKPSFVLMARQFQSFSFYDNFITVSDKKYLNPISSGSTGKYFFLLEDTLFTERNDTVFIISFRPKQGRNFNGLKGVLYINTNKYAIQNVIAEAYDSEEEFVSVKIQQKYELLEGQRWFPVQLNTNLLFNNIKAETGVKPMSITGIGKSYLLNIKLNPELDDKDFNSTYVNVTVDAHEKDEKFWDSYRIDSLTEMDKQTYKIVDSIGELKRFDRNSNMIETLFTGYIPGRYFNVDIGSLVDYNSYEGWRLGIGGITSNRLSRLFDMGGHIAYGFRDKKLKYGFNFNINLSHDYEILLSFRYSNDLAEAGGYSFLGNINILSSEYLRKFMIENMDKAEVREISFGFRTFKYLKSALFLNNSVVTSTNGYMFSLSDENPVILLDQFTYTEIGMKFRYSFNEGFMKTPYGNEFSLGTSYPVLNLNVTRGVNLLDGDFIYTKIEAKVSKSFTSGLFGVSKIQLTAGRVFGELPYSKLYNGHGSYKRFTLESEYSFATMRLNEFLSDQFVSLYLKQDFGSLLFKTKRFKPGIAFVTNVGFGKLGHPEKHNNLEFKTMEKGYYESGILINNILRTAIFGYGFGIFYRCGPYAFSKTSDNFAYKLTLKFNL
jgi:hypothetical protein